MPVLPGLRPRRQRRPIAHKHRGSPEDRRSDARPQVLHRDPLRPLLYRRLRVRHPDRRLLEPRFVRPPDGGVEVARDRHPREELLAPIARRVARPGQARRGHEPVHRAPALHRLQGHPRRLVAREAGRRAPRPERHRRVRRAERDPCEREHDAAGDPPQAPPSRALHERPFSRARSNPAASIRASSTPTKRSRSQPRSTRPPPTLEASA
jgi:hypothetical protein